MWERSPIKHVGNVTTPTLVVLGFKDRRVPFATGLEYAHCLKSNGVETRVLWYDDDHSLSKPAVEVDHWLNIEAWFAAALA